MDKLFEWFMVHHFYRLLVSSNHHFHTMCLPHRIIFSLHFLSPSSNFPFYLPHPTVCHTASIQFLPVVGHRAALLELISGSSALVFLLFYFLSKPAINILNFNLITTFTIQALSFSSIDNKNMKMPRVIFHKMITTNTNQA